MTFFHASSHLFYQYRDARTHVVLQQSCLLFLHVLSTPLSYSPNAQATIHIKAEQPIANLQIKNFYVDQPSLVGQHGNLLIRFRH